MNTIAIIDWGRGPQLSTCRLTVQDLVPYFQQKYTYEQIQQLMPVLTTAEIQAVERYIQANYDAVMEQDRRLRERAAALQTAARVRSVRTTAAARTSRSRGCAVSS